MRRVNLVEGLLQDLRYGLRILAKDPAFTAVAVLSLALGIGLNTTLFTAFDAIALKPLPVRDANSVVRLVRTLASGFVGDLQYVFSYPEYIYYRNHNRSFSGLIAASWPVKMSAQMLGEASGESQPLGEPEGIRGQLVSGNYFSVLGISPAVGRTFLPEEWSCWLPARILPTCCSRVRWDGRERLASAWPWERAGDGSFVNG